MAYALVISLKQTLEPHLDPSRSRLQIPNSEIREIYNELCYLKSFFDKMKSLKDCNSVEEVEKEIKDVLQTTRDLIECHLSDLLVHSGSEISTAELGEKMAEAKARLGSLIILLKAKEDDLTGGQQLPGVAPDVPVSSRFGSDRNNGIVGLEDEVMELKQRILREVSSLQVIPITGIAGIGKTSLAQKVYLDPQIVQHFDICLFVTIGLEYELEELLLNLLSQLGSDEMKMNELNGEELAVRLHKSLYGRRYLVVLDGVRDIPVWDLLRKYFPDNENGSAIMLTTRTSEVARRACSKENILLKRFLTNTESWELLCKMSLPEADKSAPKLGVPLAKLKKIGKKIAGKLLGIPLAVVEIGRLLSNSPPAVENWEAVDRDVSQHIQETIIPKVLKPSYAELPHHLKACFLYLGVFPPNYTIPTSQLLKLWAAEGFINVVRDEDERLELKAEEYLEDLVSRSLVEVHERSARGGIKSCRVPLHFHYVCVREAREDKLFHVVKMVNGNVAQGRLEEQRRLGVHNNVLLGLKQVRDLMRSAKDARSLLCVSSQDLRPLQLYLELRRLRVLHALSIRFWEFPNAVARLVGLKYLAITCGGELPSSISRLWNLETLIISRSHRVHPSVTLPLEIWKLRKLRHLYCMGFNLPDPHDAEMGDSLFLDKLLTLSGVSAGSCTTGVLSRMPRLIKIGIWFESTHHAVEKLFADDDPVFSHLHSLESLKCVVMDLGLPPPLAASYLVDWPLNLKKLTLRGCGFFWDLMTGIGRLPQLQVLKLQSSAFCGPRWTPVAGQFLRLEYLLLYDLDVEYMEADSSHFPVLEHLIIKSCYKLLEIPLEFGEIPTLNVIEVENCSRTVIKSARTIQNYVQHELGNEELKVVITSSWDRRYSFTYFHDKEDFVERFEKALREERGILRDFKAALRIVKGGAQSSVEDC